VSKEKKPLQNRDNDDSAALRFCRLLSQLRFRGRFSAGYKARALERSQMEALFEIAWPTFMK